MKKNKHPQVNFGKTGVLLVNLGTPDSTKWWDVRKYLKEFLSDRRVIEVNPIIKIDCYFSDWDKDVMTPVSGLFKYYDADSNWVASIDFGDGTCDEWATKTWDVDIFPDYPSGTNDFSVFDYKDKK